MDERLTNNIPEDLNEETDNIERVELPVFEFGADDDVKMQILEDTINQLPIEEQETYWQIMDNDSLELGDKVVLINDLLKRHNGDIQE